MLLERLTLENYGVYEGKSDINLSTTPKKPIVLVGGLNGAGKTTIFESIMVVLYGKTYLGTKTTKSRYLDFIADRIHKYKNGRRARNASVSLSFRFYHNGSEDSYTISRSWDLEGMSVSETLDIQKNGQFMDDVNESLWQSFVEGLVPIGIARLFFFDGEKIVRVTKWNENSNEEIKTSMDVLLGTDLINRLDADLDLYVLRKSGSRSNDAHLNKQYEDLLKEKNQVVSDIAFLDEECQKKNTALDEITSKISAKELKIAGIGGGYANMRGDLFTQKAVLEEKLYHQGKIIQEELSNDAPLYVASDILKGIQKQLEQDVNIMQQRFSILLMQEQIEDLKKDISSEKFWFDSPINDMVCEKICVRLDGMIKKPSATEFFDMSPADVEWMGHMIRSVGSGSGELLSKIEEYKKINTLLAKTESDLARIPKDDEIGPKISEINNMHQELGMLKSEIASTTQEISSKRAYQKILQSKLKTLIASLQRKKASSTGVKFATRMKKALFTYHENIKERKMAELESHLLEAVMNLLHKGMISKIKMDRETFEIMIHSNEDNEPMPVDLLSMGERQMLGTALLWAIARTTKRPLPFVIDTPLGRLDGDHRTNLINKFYPFVSHQLVLLSTDTEIEHKDYDKLSRHIARSYHIEYDRKKAATRICTGYFLEEKIA